MSLAGLTVWEVGFDELDNLILHGIGGEIAPGVPGAVFLEPSRSRTFEEPPRLRTFLEPARTNTFEAEGNDLPDPIAKTWLTTEVGRTLRFDFSNFPEIQGGETISSISAGPYCDSADVTFGTPVVTGTKHVDVRVNGSWTADSEYRIWVTVLTSNANPLTCSGILKIKTPAE